MRVQITSHYFDTIFSPCGIIARYFCLATIIVCVDIKFVLYFAQLIQCVPPQLGNNYVQLFLVSMLAVTIAQATH